MSSLDVELWPTILVVLLAGVAIVGMRLLERHSQRAAALRTREALQRALADPTGE